MPQLDDSQIRGIFSARNVLVGSGFLFVLGLLLYPATPATAALTAFVVTAALWLRLISRNQLDTVQIRRTHHPRVFEGERVPVTLRIHRGAGLPVHMVELRDQFTASLDHSRKNLVPVLSTGWEVALHAEYKADRHRGLYVLGPVLLRAGDPLGVFFEEREVAALTNLTIYPKADPLPFYRLPGPYPPGGASMDTVAQVGYGEEVLGVREYNPGDPPSRIHWRTSARRGTLHVVQLNRPVQVEVAVLADLTRRSRLGLGAESTTELGIRAAISILTRAYEARHRFSLSYTHREAVHFPAGSGLSHLHMLADRLALIVPAGETDFWEVCGPRALALTPGSRAVFIVTALGLPAAPVAELIKRLVASQIAVDLVLIDEADFIRIYRDQELDKRKQPLDFAQLSEFLTLAGARIHPLHRAQPHLTAENAECGVRSAE